MSSRRKRVRRPFSLYILTGCLLFLAMGALGGGASLIADPSGSAMQMPSAWLQGTPFGSYLVPGLFLFVIFGVGSLVAVYALWMRPKWTVLADITRGTHEHFAWVTTFVIGILLVAWIVVQYALLREFHPFQVLFGLLGVVIAGLDMLPAMRRYYAVK